MEEPTRDSNREETETSRGVYPDIKEGMRRKGGVNPVSTMPRPQEPPKPFEPAWKTPLACEGSGEPQVSILQITGEHSNEILRVDVGGDVFLNGSDLPVGSIGAKEAAYLLLSVARAKEILELFPGQTPASGGPS